MARCIPTGIRLRAKRVDGLAGTALGSFGCTWEAALFADEHAFPANAFLNNVSPHCR